ncbi:MAG: type III-B CRISPR module RAMP protein Cmr6 [Methylococcaceae bacterium]
MAEITLRRKHYKSNLDKCEHAGLMLERGFDKWDTSDNQYNEQKKVFYDHLIAISPSDFYQKAYQRWQNHLLENTATCKTWPGKVDGRLYLGLGEANPLESAVTLHHTYGVPFIPGSAIKGVLHHALVAQIAKEYDEDQKKYILEKNEQNIVDTLFGREPDLNDRKDIGDAGYVIFNDAWWIPGENPLVKEIITVHHQKYYAGEQPATDFDSPNPNPQIAIRGSFLFSVEGEDSWANYAIKLLQETLKRKGIGAKTASGYGYFQENELLQNKIEDWPDAQLGSRNLAGMGNIIEATFEGKKAMAKREEQKDFIDNLSNSAKKKLNKHALTRAIKVRKSGNSYHIVELMVDK